MKQFSALLLGLSVFLCLAAGGFSQEPAARERVAPETDGNDKTDVIDEILDSSEPGDAETDDLEAIDEKEDDYSQPGIELPDLNPRRFEGAPGDWRIPRSNGQLGNVLQGHWISMDDDGVLQGRISTINPNNLNLEPTGGLNIRFIQEGQVLASTGTDRAGRFAISGLEPGVYSVVATGPNGFLACRVTVLRSKRQIELGLHKNDIFPFAY